MRKYCRRTRASLLARCVLVAISSASITDSARGQVSATWTGLGDTQSFTDPYNWSSFPNLPGDAGEATAGGPYHFINSSPLTQNITLSRVRNVGPFGWQFGSGSASITLVGPAEWYTNVGPAASPTNFRWNDLVNAPIHGSAGLTKLGPGVLGLQSNNTYTGGTRVLDGWIVPYQDSAFGAPGEAVTLDGAGMYAGADHSTRAFTLGAGGGTFLGKSLGSATFGAISGPGALTTESEAFSSGVATINLVDDATHHGETRVLSGRLFVRAGGTTQGRLTNTSRVVASGSLNLAGAADLINDNAPVALRGGAVAFSSAGANAEQILRLDLETGRGLTSGTFVTGSIQRTAGASWRLSGAAQPTVLVPSGLVGSGAAGSPDIGVLPFAASVPGAAVPVTIDAGKVRALTTAEQHTMATLPSPISPTMNLRAGTSDGNPTPISVRSLALGVIFGGATVTINGGGIYLPSTATGSISNAIEFSSAEGFIHGPPPASSSAFLFAGPIGGSAGVTINGGAALTGASTYTGDTHVNGTLEIRGSVLSGAPNPLGLDTSAVVIASDSTSRGSLRFNNAGTQTIRFERDLKFVSDGRHAARLVASGTSPVEIAGDIEIHGVLRADTPGNRPFTIIGDLSGPGMLMVTQVLPGTLPSVTLAGANTYAGGTELTGAVAVGSDSALGTGPLWVEPLASSAVIDAINGPRVLANTLQNHGTLIFNGTNPLTFLAHSRIDTIDLRGAHPISFPGGASNIAISTLGSGTLQTAWYRGLRIAADGTSRVEFIAGNTATSSRSDALTIASGAAVDLNDHTLVLERGGGTLTGGEAGVRAMLASNRLISTVAANAPGTGIGYALAGNLFGTENGDPPVPFAGQLVREHDLLIRYTLLGDADIDGDVDIADFARVGANFNVADSFWFDGDFNYDATTDIADFAQLAANFNVSLPRASVPEPSMLVGFVVMAGAAMRRRGRC